MTRTFEIVHDGLRPLTVNGVVNLHRHAWAKRTRTTRGLWFTYAREHDVPPMERAAIEATPLHKNRASPQDVAACAPEVKAAIDGLIDAEVLPDDDATHLVSITFLPPEIVGFNGLRLRITEVAS